MFKCPYFPDPDGDVSLNIYDRDLADDITM